MKTPINEFEENINLVKKLTNLHDLLSAKYKLQPYNIPDQPYDISDILRIQYVNMVSALDRFIHEIVKIGLSKTFLSRRCLTRKAQTLPLQAQFLLKMLSSEYSEIEKAEMYEFEIVRIMTQYSFQNEKTIKDALSYIWEGDQKFQKIAERMSIFSSKNSENKKNLGQVLGQKLTLISQRRNQIVHEADIEYETNERRKISPKEVQDDCALIDEFVHSIWDNLPR